MAHNSVGTKFSKPVSSQSAARRNNNKLNRLAKDLSSTSISPEKSAKVSKVNGLSASAQSGAQVNPDAAPSGSGGSGTSFATSLATGPGGSSTVASGSDRPKLAGVRRGATASTPNDGQRPSTSGTAGSKGAQSNKRRTARKHSADQKRPMTMTLAEVIEASSHWTLAGSFVRSWICPTRQTRHYSRIRTSSLSKSPLAL